MVFEKRTIWMCIEVGGVGVKAGVIRDHSFSMGWGCGAGGI